MKLYIDKAKREEVLRELTRIMTRKNEFLNIDIKPYKGKKFDQQTTEVIIIG